MAKGMLLLQPVLQFFDNSGLPLNGGKLYFYSPSSTTPKNTYTDSTKNVANANPIILDSAGRPDNSGTPVNIYLDGSYKIVVKTSADVAIRTVDPINTLGQLINTRSTTSTDSIAATDRDYIVEADASSAGFTINVLAAATAGAGFRFGVQKIDSSINLVTIDYNSSETGNASATFVIRNQWETIYFTSDGTQWIVERPANLRDNNNLIGLDIGTTASSVNNIRVTNAATGTGPTISAVGSDTNIDLNISAKGTGVIKLTSPAWFNGGLNTQSVTTTTTLTSASYGKCVVCSGSSSYAVTLPAASAGNYIDFVVVTSNSALITLTPAAGTINQQATVIYGVDEGCRLYTDGSNWFITSQNLFPVNFSVYSGGQTVSNNTATKVTLNTKVFDIGTYFDVVTNFRHTPMYPGKYLYTAYLQYVSTASEAQSTVYIYKNGTEYARANIGTGATNVARGGTVSSLISMNGTTDYIELFTLQASGGSLATAATASTVYMSGNRFSNF